MDKYYLASWSIILPVLLLCASCQTTKEPADTAEAPPLPVQTTPPIDQAVLRSMLEQAEAAIAEDHLTYPAEGSAYAIYARILDIQPGQEDAQRGMEHIVEQYIALAMHAIQQNRLATARSMLSRARLINPDHPSIAPTDQQIRLLSQADKKILKLSQSGLSNPEGDTADALRALARNRTGSACRYTISARSDAQGRWIYQRLAEGARDGGDANRIRAQIQIRTPSRVERLCFTPR